MAEAREIVEAMSRAHDPVGWNWHDHAGVDYASAKSVFIVDQMARNRAGALALLDKMQEPSEAMIAAYFGALKVHIEAMPAEVKAANRAKYGGYLVDNRTKAHIRFAAMLAELRREIAALGEEGR